MYIDIEAIENTSSINSVTMKVLYNIRVQDEVPNYFSKCSQIFEFIWI